MDDIRADESLVDIDLYNLHLEWLEHAKKVLRFGNLLADAKKKSLQAKATLELVEAKLELKIRKNPKMYNLPDKLTETVIKMTVLVQDDYQNANRRYINARHRVDLLSGAIEALQHRKKAIEDLVTLHGQAYFAEPSVRKEDRHTLEENTKREVRSRVAKKRG